MSKRSPKSVEEKLELVQLYQEQGVSISTLVSSYGVASTTIKKWIRKYENSGIDGLKESRTWKQYSKELKEQAVQDYLNNLGSLETIIEKYHISSQSVLKRWINQYTSDKALQTTSKGLSRMKQGRKTTFEERVEIVNFTIAHDKDYQAAIEKYGISYQQVYSWVRKFEKDGSQGLLDRRGKGLESKLNLTPEEELQLKIKQLEERNRYLEMEVGLPKKVRRNQTQKPTVRIGRYLEEFQAIKDYSDKHSEASISQLCQLIGVSRSGYYKWLNHKETTSEETNRTLLKTIKELHTKRKGILGYRRMTRAVNRKLGTTYNKKRIRRLMRILGISSIIRRSRGYCTKTSFVNIEENILNREFAAHAPNQKWCTDVTFLQYGRGCKAYLSAIKDLYDGSIVAYHISKHNDNPLVMETLRKAIEINSGATPLLHSDRGSQYTSREYRMVTTQYQMTRSMSRVGKCIDNAPIESFFGHFKTECYDLKDYKTFEELVYDIDDYIYFYNNERFQEKHNGLAPLEVRNKA
ncbi:TPA: IS3 family transposase, partial [Streptococcus equi subsp. zooepidemicus]|nr:IS3 family transposase [Streptococcus equi subsp. zooepidemicus]HEL0040669.1 IS3 family transposase [Streptococcus equi subsp. zooepidemicus]HEL0042977.1 IS3 family transposase [Streptococcus equi subsp. zooepidemicus]HEL0044620.1 IS3 family transposase [Streptococcus equi subsp. zooepidemicus]HEL0052675.1 IS3 family transposase [Streptococcus equi subsp. zooepidemicus]